MFRDVEEPDGMGGIFKKGLPGLAVLRDPRFAFDAEHFVGNLKVVARGHQAPQSFRDMGIEIVEDEDACRLDGVPSRP